MKTFDDYRNAFSSFYESVKRAHEQSERQHRGHGFDHDVTVAMLGVYIAPNEKIAQMAWSAGMLHSIDRLVDYKKEGLVEKTTRELLMMLSAEFFTIDDIEEICQSAIRHGELNQDNQSVTQQVLMDADRLANLMPAVVIRAGQLLADIPAFDFKYLGNENDPSGDYHKPKSVLDDLHNNLREYPPKLRIQKAKDLAEEYVSFLKTYLIFVKKSNADLNLEGISL